MFHPPDKSRWLSLSPLFLVDSSALVKRYVPETGSAWIRALSAPDIGNPLIIARITWVEVRSALARRQREGSLTSADATLIIQRFRSDLNNQYQVIELDATLAETAGQLVNQYPLRAYDAVQLASVLLLQPAFSTTQSTSLIFLTADDRLSAIASALGLLTDNPNTSSLTISPKRSRVNLMILTPTSVPAQFLIDEQLQFQ